MRSRLLYFDSYAKGAPWPHGFSFLFYQVFWETIKIDFMKLVKDFESDELNLDRNNYAINIITLTSKDTKAKHLKKFRPIIVVLRFFANALNNRLIKIADRLICANQTTFIKRRFILESMIESGLILKLDYEKAYDRVS
jgi:hypothetical protein